MHNVKGPPCSRERSEQCGASERESNARERVNGRERGKGRANDPVLQSVILVILDHSAGGQVVQKASYF